MTQEHITVLNTYTVRVAFKQAWENSNPGITGGHEEGGFVVRDSTNNLSVVRCPKGVQNSIILPLHPKCKIEEADIVATFHTHPNIGSDYLQEPSETDKRAVRDDPDLKGDFYVGEFVISQAKIYLITPNGQVNGVEDTQIFLTEG